MSLSSVAASARRASEAVKAAPPVAKRGMFALVERRHSYTSLKNGNARWAGYTPCIVSSVSRNGLAREVRIVGQGWPLKQRDWASVTVDSAGRIADPEAVVRRLVDADGRAIEYRDHSEALAAIKTAAGLQ